MGILWENNTHKSAASLLTEYYTIHDIHNMNPVKKFEIGALFLKDQNDIYLIYFLVF